MFRATRFGTFAGLLSAHFALTGCIYPGDSGTDDTDPEVGGEAPVGGDSSVGAGPSEGGSTTSVKGLAPAPRRRLPSRPARWLLRGGKGPRRIASARWVRSRRCAAPQGWLAPQGARLPKARCAAGGSRSRAARLRKAAGSRRAARHLSVVPVKAARAAVASSSPRRPPTTHASALSSTSSWLVTPTRSQAPSLARSTTIKRSALTTSRSTRSPTSSTSSTSRTRAR